MTVWELYKKIGMPEEMDERIRGLLETFDFSSYEWLIRQMMDAETAEGAFEKLRETLGEDPQSDRMLICQLDCGARQYDAYQKMGIPDSIYFDTMKCFARFVRECRQKTGKVYFDRAYWAWRMISMQIFRIGQLEYERYRKDGEKCVHVHIPSDARFDEESVSASLAASRDFFRTYDPEFADVEYTCDSWLLSPMLKEFLDENSNIIKFQKRFYIIENDYSSVKFVEWLFQTPLDTDYTKLKEETSLQRKAKKALLEGRPIGWSYGVLRSQP